MILWVVGILFLGAALLFFAAGLLISIQITRRHTGHTRRSPAEFSLEFENISLLTSDGVTLHGWWIPAGESRRTIILLHGQAGSMDPDLQYAPALHAAKYNVLMFDFRAHGRSGGSFSSVGWLERLDVLAAVQEAQRRGSRRIGLLGFSMGGRAAVLAAPFSQAIGALVSDDGPACLTTAVRGRLAESGIPGWLAKGLAWMAVNIASLRAGVDLSANDLLQRVSQVSPRPLLFIHGLHDPYITPGEFNAMVQAAGDHVQVWTAEAGHRLVDTLDPQEYRRRVIEFFDTSL